MSWSWHWWIFIPVLGFCVIGDYYFRLHFSHEEAQRAGSEAERQASFDFVAALINGALFAGALTAVVGFLV